MKLIYLDNGASTRLDDQVIDYMAEVMKSTAGNPSSTHQFGRTAKSLVEQSRKRIASALNCDSSEIIFTGSGSEADNLVLRNAVDNLGVKRIVSTKIEHAAVINTLKDLEVNSGIEIVYLDVDQKGEINLAQLEEVLNSSKVQTLVSLMYVNNEIGTILPIKRVGDLCQEYKSYFHTDAVQAVGHLAIDLSEIHVDFLVGSAHKFHGPKGVGFAFFRKGSGIRSMITGGGQEKGVRAGTENVHSIAGMAEALDLAIKNLESESKHITEVKKYAIDSLKTFMPEIEFNANSDALDDSAYHILSVRFPGSAPMLLFSLDLNGIAVSGGSACQSGSNKGSHVLSEVLDSDAQNHTSIRVSFSKYNTKEDIDAFIDALKSI
ncbi:MAG: cysteine desulfurase family protein [Flavobacteriaceae bacterium]